MLTPDYLVQRKVIDGDEFQQVVILETFATREVVLVWDFMREIEREAFDAISAEPDLIATMKSETFRNTSLYEYLKFAIVTITVPSSASPFNPPLVQVRYANDTILDGAGRLRQSVPRTLFESSFVYDTDAYLWANKTVGTATITHVPVSTNTSLSIGTASGDRVVRQSRQYFQYRIGKSHMFVGGLLFTDPQVGTEKLVGIGDDSNGIFIGQDGDGLFVLVRSSASGIVSDVLKVYREDWSEDRLDKSGPSGIDIDFQTLQTLFIDYEWAGAGRVRIGLIINGQPNVCHIFEGTNNLPLPYIATPTLPIRYEIKNTQAVSAPSTLSQYACTLVSENGGPDKVAYPFSASILDVAIPIGEENAIIVFASRHQLTYNGIVNRGTFRPIVYEVLPQGGKVVTEVLYDPTVVAGSPWQAVNVNSIMEGNTDITSFTNGTVINTAIATGGSTKANTPVFGETNTSRLPVGLDIDGANPIVLALKAYTTDASVTASFAFHWEEER